MHSFCKPNKLLFLGLIFLLSSNSFAQNSEKYFGNKTNATEAVEVVKIIDPDNGPGTDYTSLDDFAKYEQRDLVAAGEIAVALCRSSGGTPDEPAQFVDWVTDENHYVKIVADVGHRANAQWDTTKYRILEFTTINSECLDIEIDNIVVDGIQMRIYGSGRSNDVIDPDAGDYYIFKNCFLWMDLSSGSGDGMDFKTDGEVVNCIIKGPSSEGINVLEGAFVKVINNTFIGWEHAIKSEGTVLALNNISIGAFGEPYETDDDGTFTSDSDYNTSHQLGKALVKFPRSSNASPWYSGATPVAQIFVDSTANDYHLLANSIFSGSGIGPTADNRIPIWDINLQRRSGAATDLGADHGGLLGYQYTVDVTIIDSGQVTLNPDDSLYYTGTPVEISAIPDSAYRFVGWSSNLSGFGNPDTIVVDSNIAITATFIRQFQLTSGTPVNGSISFSPDTTGGGIYDSATVVTLTPIADSGFVFTGWSGDLMSVANPDSIQMDSNIYVQAHFDTAYYLTVNASNGSVVLDPPGGIYDSARVVSMTAVPDSAYRFTGWSGDLISIDNPDTVQLDTNITVTAHFLRMFSLTSNTISGGNITFSPDTTGGAIYDSATVVTFSATPDSGYRFVGWSGAISSDSTTDSVRVDSNTAITATFIPQYQLAASVVGSGSVSFSPDTTGGAIYDSATVITLTAIPDSGQVFSGWSGDLLSSANPDSIQLDSNTTIIATFQEYIAPTLNLKAFLEGPYNNGAMDTTLNSIGNLPLAQPYNIAPWNYSGSEVLSAIPADMVDWVLLELRSQTGAESAIARRAALLNKSGQIVDTTGLSPVTFQGVDHGAYYVVVFHRNHLAVMSAAPLSVTDSTALHDFSIAQTQGFGISPMKTLAPAVFGMYSGDSNGDGSVDSTDKNIYWRAENATLWNYNKLSDYNLDGGIDTADKNQFWMPNNGTSTAVPDSNLAAHPGTGNGKQRAHSEQQKINSNRLNSASVKAGQQAASAKQRQNRQQSNRDGSND